MADIGYVVFSNGTTTYYPTFNAAITAAQDDPGAVFHVTAQVTGSDVYAGGVTTFFEGGSQKTSMAD